MSRNELLRERIRAAADDAAKLSLRLAALSKRPEIEASTMAELLMRSVESDVDAIHVRDLEKYALPTKTAERAPEAA